MSVQCPLCGDGEMLLEELLNPKGVTQNDRGERITPIWVCDTCPGVLMEWHNEEDTRAVQKRLG